ncbi:MAG TPA: hypothetical protein DEP53_16415, partial [Bacteroidetes bacterium]|nr:hypothetical protein [Bacteroidota bacterium]
MEKLASPACKQPAREPVFQRSCMMLSYAILVDSLLNQNPSVEIVFQLKMTTFSIGQIHSSSVNTFELTGA